MDYGDCEDDTLTKGQVDSHTREQTGLKGSKKQSTCNESSVRLSKSGAESDDAPHYCNSGNVLRWSELLQCLRFVVINRELGMQSTLGQTKLLGTSKSK